MTDPATIFQRTHSGREEIHKKSHGLTQSERLVLIMVDGVSSYKEIRAKLPVLTDDRFARALQKLQAKDLVLEVFMPLDGQAPDELERTVIDRFLQQDPMDPVTVILRDPEDELGMLSHDMKIHTWTDVPSTNAAASVLETAPAEARASAAVLDDAPLLTIPTAQPTRPPRPEPTLDAEDVLAADALMEELRARRAMKSAAPLTQPVPIVIPEQIMQPYEELNPFKAVHWGYWLIVSGLSFIVGFVLARITS
ncbi:hypothetical protein [Noviherbaspirillum sp. ST9]|uniref:hypothetical protein n=1 Tax=Noviherbaspirillum sp. ST9 TaxID=3401606 RepID=UPI003B587481